MRRIVLVLALAAVCGLLVAPASAQTRAGGWFLNAGVGPSYGTLGTTPVVNASAGYDVSDRVRIGAEFGMLPHAPFDKAGTLAPNVSVLTPGSDLHVNAYHANANVFVQPARWGRLTPYGTVGVGTFTGSTVAKADLGTSRLVQYERETNPAENVGGGATYQLTRWLGLNADYRHFIVNASDTTHVNRFTTGVSLTFR
jgi:opacity protein-like surface antigen